MTQSPQPAQDNSPPATAPRSRSLLTFVGSVKRECFGLALLTRGSSSR